MTITYALAIAMLSAIGGWSGAFLSGYLKRKGENLATKEDVGEITKKVEGIRADFVRDAQSRAHEQNVFIESFKAHQNLRTLAGPERLRASQEAFALWRALFDADIADFAVMDECNDWWRKNCLYLDAPARQAFIEGVAAWHGRAILMSPANRDPANHEPLTRLMATFMATPDAIMKGAGLPPLAEQEKIASAALSENDR
ncbi:hypothetical protein [Rhodanobacter soli]|uniref:Uncharacterized protein n=1 Tax=Rhodanobacter soli TaxID=590609 RepID=A0ABV2PS65_9GAMM